jgi:Ras family protein A
MAPSEQKIVVVGDGACGKTCLLVGFVRDEFPRDYVHTMFNTYTKQLTVNKRRIKLSLWDTAGQPEYDRIRPMAYHDTDVFLLCFALDRPDSFNRILDKWLPEIRQFCPNAPVILVGTKKDLRCNSYTNVTDRHSQIHEQISTEEGKYLAKKCAMFEYMECSSETSAGVREVFETAVRAAQYSVESRKRARKRRSRCAIL